MNEKKPGFIVVGLALFCMFFGSGNLIFPLMLGRDAGSAFLISSFGFVLSAVIVPCFGMIAISFAEGSYEQIFEKVFKKRVAVFLIFIILLSFIPFGAGPRCVVLAHASLKTFMPMPSLWIFSLIFLAIVAYLIIDRSRLIGTLANILTPLLLISIACMVVSAFIHGEADPQTMTNYDLFMGSLFQGYNTQDLLSSLFFSSSLILLLKTSYPDRKAMIVTMLKGALLGVILLTTLYILLIAASSLHSDILIGHSGIDLVSILAKHTLGHNFGLIAGIGVALACLTTEVALVMAFAEFIEKHFLRRDQSKYALPISLLSVYFTALLEFEGIMKIVSPVMQIMYPIIVIVVLKFLFHLWSTHRNQNQKRQ